MLFVNNPALAGIKRTLRPNYAWSQATPNDAKLDPNWDRSVKVYPGMVFMKTRGNAVTLLDGTGSPYGLVGIYLGGDGIDECLPSGNNSCPVWVLGPDAEFEVIAPAFDTDASWVDPANGKVALVHAHTTGPKRGKLCPAGTAGASTLPVARLIRVDSANKIVVGGLNVVDAV